MNIYCNKKGFTIYEVIIVLALISILAVVALPIITRNVQSTATCLIVEENVRSALATLNQYYTMNQTFDGVSFNNTAGVNLVITYSGQERGQIVGSHTNCLKGYFVFDSTTGQAEWTLNF